LRNIIERVEMKKETTTDRATVGMALRGNFLFLKEKLDISHFF
jgi:hypothetical protein